MNSINIIGNLTKDVELKYTQSNKAVTTVTLALNEGFGDNKKTYYVDVQIWEKQAENLAKYCGKGSKIAVSGKLVQQTWEYEDKKQSKVLIQAFNVMFLDNKNGQASKEPSQTDTSNYEDPFSNFGNEVSISDDDLPFL